MVNVLRTPRLSTKPTPKANGRMDDRKNKHFPRELTGVQKWESVCVQWVSRIFECMTVYDMPDTILGRSGRIRQSNLSTN